MRRVRVMLMTTALAGCTLALGACQVPVDTCGAGSSVLGAWHYAGQQDAPPARSAGTLTVTSESCDGFRGLLDLIETDGTGRTRRLSGPVSGRMIDGTSIRFDAFLEAAPRQHLASLHGDSVQGSWLAVGGPSTSSLTGTFTGLKVGSP